MHMFYVIYIRYTDYVLYLYYKTYVGSWGSVIHFISIFKINLIKIYIDR